jgi:hypothetical protein
MAMTAQQFLATRTPAEQAQVNASLQSSGSTIDQWFQAAVDAGEPDAVRAAGGQAVEGGGDGVGVVGGQGAPSSEWLGKRKPTPSELIRYYGETGKSEDFRRYSAAQVADWINRKWDVAGGNFTNDFGDVVEKPTESGPQSQAAGFATGERDAGRAGGGGGGKPPVAAAPVEAPQDPNDPLQARLLEMYQGGEGAFAGSRAKGQDLAGGGIWWGNGGANNAAIPAPGGADGISDILFGGATSGGAIPAGVNPALAQAAMTAFTPSAPSAQGGGYTGKGSQIQAPVQSAIAPQVASTQPASSTTPTRIPTPSTPAGANPLADAVQRRFRDPNSWWAGQKTY